MYRSTSSSTTFISTIPLPHPVGEAAHMPQSQLLLYVGLHLSPCLLSVQLRVKLYPEDPDPLPGTETPRANKFLSSPSVRQVLLFLAPTATS